jgi:putative endonuclease
MWTVYILQCDRAFFYVGITEDINKRLLQHKSGHSSHTSRYSNIDLVYTEKQDSRMHAEKREKQLKGWSRAKKKALIMNDIDLLKKLSNGS